MHRCLLLLASLVAAATVSPPAFVLPAVLPAHPRLILTPARAAGIAALVASRDAAALGFAAAARAQAAWLLGVRPPHTSSNSSTPSARPLLQNLYSLALASAADGGNATLRARAVEEIYNASLSPQWDADGSAQLNTGEMLHVVAMGLDWLYDDLSAAQRAALVSAAVSTGLSRIRAALLGSPPPSWAVAFVSTPSNWNGVILGGAILACLAVIGEPGTPPWVAAELLPAALSNLRSWSASAWGPDGAWPEGPNYGGYAARYLAPTIAALQSATGDDAGLLALPGVLKSTRFCLAAMTPSLQFWFYFDARSDPETVAAYLFFAAAAGDAAAVAGMKALVAALAPSVPANASSNNVMNGPVALLYALTEPVAAASRVPGAAAAAAAAALPLVSAFRGPEVLMARAAAAGAPLEESTFIGFKGLNTSALWAHTHLDAGSFVFQARGQWFAQDLGSDQYSAPGYFSPTRFRLYRTGVRGHNTLSFAGDNTHCVPEQTYTSNCTAAPFTTVNATATGAPGAPADFPVDAYAIVDLTAAIGAALDIGLSRAQRGVIIGAARTQLITVDEVALSAARGAPPPPPLWWSLHTVANISLSADGRTATLTTWNVSVPVTVAVLPSATACPGAAFNVTPIDLLPPLLPSPGVFRLTLAAPATTCTRLAVAVGVQPPSDVAGLRPLAEWAAAGSPFA